MLHCNNITLNFMGSLALSCVNVHSWVYISYYRPSVVTTTFIQSYTIRDEKRVIVYCIHMQIGFFRLETGGLVIFQQLVEGNMIFHFSSQCCFINNLAESQEKRLSLEIKNCIYFPPIHSHFIPLAFSPSLLTFINPASKMISISQSFLFFLS